MAYSRYTTIKFQIAVIGLANWYHGYTGGHETCQQKALSGLLSDISQIPLGHVDPWQSITCFGCSWASVA